MTYCLSPFTLNLLEDCSRCFWLAMVKKIKRPSGPVSSIPVKMDSIIKHYFDNYRSRGELPPLVHGQVQGTLPIGMPKSLKYDVGNGIVLWGRPDDYLEDYEGRMAPFDHKTRSRSPDTVHDSYRLQLDVYSYLLRMNGYNTSDKGFIAYYCPDDSDLHDGMRIHCKVIEVAINLGSVDTLILKACDILNGAIPDSGLDCEYCKWASAVQNELILSQGI